MPRPTPCIVTRLPPPCAPRAIRLPKWVEGFMTQPAHWLALVVLLLAGVGNAWGQNVPPTITVTPQRTTITLGPSLPTVDIRINEDTGGDFNYTITGSPRPVVTLAVTAGRVPVPARPVVPIVSFGQLDVGVNTFDLTATNAAGSVTTTFTVIVIWDPNGGGQANGRQTNGHIYTVNLHVPITWQVLNTNRFMTTNGVRTTVRAGLTSGVPRPSQQVQRVNLRSRTPSIGALTGAGGGGGNNAPPPAIDPNAPQVPPGN